MNEVDVDVADSELCENCHAREAYGTFNVADVETWLCNFCASLVSEVEPGLWMVVFN